MRVLKTRNVLELPSYTETAAYEVEIASFIDKLKGVPDKAKNAIKDEFKHQVHHIAENFGTTKSAIVKAWQEPKPMNILKACGYSFATMYGAYHMAHKVAEEGALHVIAHLAEHNAGHKVGHAVGHKLHKAQDLIKKHPVLAKLTGPALAGMMLYGYTLTEPHALGDWNMSNVKKAFTGEFGVADFMATPEAVSLGIHVASGKVLSLSSLAHSLGTLTAGLCATAIMESENPKLKKLQDKVGSILDGFKSKRNPLVDLESSKEFTGTKETMGIEPADVGQSSHAKDGKMHEPTVDTEKNGRRVEEDKPTKSKKPKPKKEEEKKKLKKGASKWWDSLDEDAQKAYLKSHPHSIYQ